MRCAVVSYVDSDSRGRSIEPQDHIQRRDRPRSSLDRTALIALLLPALGYAAAYYYRLGQAQEYGLPSELVSLDLKDAIVGGLGVAFASAIVVAVLNFVVDFLEGVFPSALERALISIAVPFAGMAVVLYMAGPPTQFWIAFTATFALCAFIQFGRTLFIRSGEEGYLAKLDAAQRRNATDRPMPFTRLMRGRREVALALSIVYLVLFIASPAGAYSARIRTTFAVLQSTPERVVVSEYRGCLVTLVLNRDAHSATGPVVIVDPEEQTAGFAVERLGILDFSQP